MLETGKFTPLLECLIILVGKLRSFIVIRLICCLPPSVHSNLVSILSSLHRNAVYSWLPIDTSMQ
jgi:hypothetical protein